MSLHFTVRVIKYHGMLGIAVGEIVGFPAKWDENVSREVALLQYTMMGAVKANKEMEEALQKKDMAKVQTMMIEANAYMETQRSNGVYTTEDMKTEALRKRKETSK